MEIIPYIHAGMQTTPIVSNPCHAVLRIRIQLVWTRHEGLFWGERMGLAKGGKKGVK